jgi:hypothetical protein
MTALAAIIGLVFTAFAILVTLAVVGLVLKFALKLLLLPLLLVKWLVVSVVMLIVSPVLFVAGLIASVAFLIALAIPLLPFVLLAALVWIVVRATRPPVAA